MRSPSGFLRGYVIFERFSRFFRVVYAIPFTIIKAIHEKSQRARRHNARTPKPETGKFLFGFRKNRYEFLGKNQMATVGLWRKRRTRALEKVVHFPLGFCSARVGTTREPLSHRLKNSCLVFAKIGKNFFLKIKGPQWDFRGHTFE